MIMTESASGGSAHCLTNRLLSGKYTRQDLMKVTGIKSGSLSYLDSQGIVSPEKIGNPAHPVVLYSLDDLLAIAAIMEMKREGLSLFEIRKVIERNQRLGFKLDTASPFAQSVIQKASDCNP